MRFETHERTFIATNWISKSTFFETIEEERRQIELTVEEDRDMCGEM